MSDRLLKESDVIAYLTEEMNWYTDDGYEVDEDEKRDDMTDIVAGIPTAETKTGEWEFDPNGMDWNIPAWRCSECGFVANYIGVEANGLGNNPMNWAGSKFCPQCGARITGYER